MKIRLAFIHRQLGNVVAIDPHNLASSSTAPPVHPSLMSNLVNYRAFRASVLQEIGDERIHARRRFDVDDTKLSSFGIGRLKIGAFRSEVVETAAKILGQPTEKLPLVRRALGIRAPITLVPSKWQKVGQFMMNFRPIGWRMQRARSLLDRASTFEGRRYLFEHFIRSTLPERCYYDNALDFALRSFEPAKSFQDIKYLSYQSKEYLKVAYRLGLRSVDDMRRNFPESHKRLSDLLLLLLVDEGVIQCVEELSWGLNRRPLFYEALVTADHLRQARFTVQILMMHGVERKLIAGLFRHPIGNLHSERLSENLALFQGVDGNYLSKLLEEVGGLLWLAPKTNWQFLLKMIGAQTSEEIGSFRRLLQSHRDLSAEFAKELLVRGARLDDIAACQQLLLEVSRGRTDVSFSIDGLRRLSSGPHALRFDQIAQCAGYLADQGDLTAFLAVLVDRGYGAADAVLAFQKCYAKVSAPVLDRILGVLGARGQGEPLELIATWAEQAGREAYLDSLEYLVSATEVPNLDTLRQSLKFLRLGEPFLRYAIEDRGLKTIKKINDWYYDDANGIDSYRSWAPLDALDKVMLDDAWPRRQFNQLNGNMECVANLIAGRVTDLLGPWPWDAGEAVKIAYTHAKAAAELKGRSVLLQCIPQILQRTGGVLLPSLFEGVWTGNLKIESQLARLSPLLSDLLEGRGPVGSHLNLLDAEGIALVYRVTPNTVTSQWSQVVGRESDIGTLKLRVDYPMAWTRAHWKIRSQLDGRGFLALEKAGEFAKRFLTCFSSDMRAACRRLSPKQLAEPSRDLETLASHLGSLLSVASADEVIAHWLSHGFEALASIDGESVTAYQRMGDLVALFDVVLPDALDAHTDRYVQNLPDQDARHWASRLGNVENVAGGGQAQLRANLARVRATVIPHYLAWANRQMRKFKKSSTGSQTTQPLLAVISKHPAAFFAKAAVGLCTADNIEMWREQRLSHLLVFDRPGRRLAGMALLYVELIPAIDRMRPSLVIRALNPTNEMLAGHDVGSIVTSFFAVAIQLAQDNDLACVALPTPNGMHLISNHQSIENYIQERYISRAANVWQNTSDADALLSPQVPQCVKADFYAYEHGKERVQELYVIWRAMAEETAADQRAPVHALWF